MIKSFPMKRRDFIKATSTIVALLPSMSFSTTIEKNKKVDINCNLCSVGCHGSSDSNFCIKGYSTFEYDKNKRLTQPLLRLKDGKYDKSGKLTPVTWQKALEIMSYKMKNTSEKFGPNGIGLFTSGNLGIIESYTLNKFFKAGFRSNNIYNTNHYTAYPSMVASVQVFGNDGVYGNFDDIQYSDACISWGINFAETYPILFTKILEKKDSNKNFEFINITTYKNKTSDFATSNLVIKPNSDTYLLKYLLHNFLEQNETKLNWNLLKERFIFAKLNSKTHEKLDELSQWEISYYEYKKSLQKYTLDFVVQKIKAKSEDIKEFKTKLLHLSSLFNDFKLNISSFWSSGINKQKYAIDLNVLIYSLHLLSNKHSKPGCAMMSLTGQPNSLVSSTLLGTYTHRLPANMYVKYKEHRTKCETIWNIPFGTINPETSPKQNQLLENIQTKKTKFVWIIGANPYKSTPQLQTHIEALEKNKECFLVTSDYFMSESCEKSDLVLPTAMPHEKETISCNNDKKIHYQAQENIPQGEATSEIWQILELSKYVQIKDVWNLNKIDDTTLLINVIGQLKNFNYEPNDSLYRILFNNPKAKSYTSKNNKKNYLNSEVNGDTRDIITQDGLLFFGYKYYIQKYLYEEMRLFFSGVAYDFPHFDTLIEKDIKWPYIFNKEIHYRFNPLDDIYANRASKLKDLYIFYGKMGGKTIAYGNFEKILFEQKEELKYRAKIFTTNEYDDTTLHNENYYLHQIKVLEHINTGTLTNNNILLQNAMNQSFCYMSKKDMKKLKLNNQDLILVQGKLKSVLLRAVYDSRFDLETGHLAIANFGTNISLNLVTESLTDTYVSVKKWEKKDV